MPTRMGCLYSESVGLRAIRNRRIILRTMDQLPLVGARWEIRGTTLIKATVDVRQVGSRMDQRGTFSMPREQCKQAGERSMARGTTLRGAAPCKQAGCSWDRGGTIWGNLEPWQKAGKEMEAGGTTCGLEAASWRQDGSALAVSGTT